MNEFTHVECIQRASYLGNRIKALEAENERLIELLAKERDEFGCKETELWQQIKRLKQKKEARK